MKKIIFPCVLFISSFLLSSCDFLDMFTSTSDPIQNENSDFEVIMFNQNASFDETGKITSRNINGMSPADCYMVKSGDVEILIDCGLGDVRQNKGDFIEIFSKILFPKIKANIVGDLDYLIVTHGHDDHFNGISGIDSSSDSNNHTLFNYIANPDKYEVNFKIKNLIDFDSTLVRFLCSNVKNESGHTYGSPYVRYRKLVDQLLNHENKYIENYANPSYFFGDEMLKKTFKSDSMVEKIKSDFYLNAMPIYFINNPNNLEYVQTVPSNDEKSLYYQRMKNSDLEEEKERIKFTNKGNVPGKLVNVGNNEETKLYYEINLNNKCKLRILYNWYYHHFYKSTNSPQGEGTIENNLSLGIQVTNNKQSFITFGDLAGSAEAGVLNYYKNTDVFRNVGCYKASHHGSTSNNESTYFFGSRSLEGVTPIAPKTILVPGVLSKRRINLDSNDPLYSKISTTAVCNDDFYKMVIKNSNDVKILIPNAYQQIDNQFYFTPVHGDIHVKITGNELTTDCTNKNEVSCYLDMDTPNYNFEIYNNGPISIHKTEWFKKVYGEN